MRIMVYGNSHVMAWREAWAGMAAEVPGVEMVFFSLPEKIRQRYRFRATGLFAPRRSVTPDELERVGAMNEGQTSCAPGAADVAVCVGAAWYPERAMGFAALGDPPDAALASGGRMAFGPGVVQAALDEASAAALGEWQIGAGRARRPIVFGRPVYAVTCLQATHRLYAPWVAAAAYPEAAAWFAQAHRDRLVAHAAEKGVDFMAPPAALHGELGLTRAEFLAEGGGIVDLQNAALRGDHSHMNAAYGRACIQQLLAGLDAG
jgi:hypothetical protein